MVRSRPHLCPRLAYVRLQGVLHCAQPPHYAIHTFLAPSLPLFLQTAGPIVILSSDVPIFHSPLFEEGRGGMTFSLLSPWFAFACLFLFAYMRSAPHSGGNSPYPHIFGSLLVFCIIVPALLGYSPAPSSNIWTWTAYLSLWLVPIILIIYCLLLSPLHVVWSPADLLIRRKELDSSNPPARILYDPEISHSGYTAHDVVAEYVRCFA